VIKIIIKFKPIYFDKIWGGNKLNKMFDYASSEKCGEAWGISAYHKSSSIILNGKFAGLTLRELFLKERVLFGNYPSNEFPILVKVIDANADLSVQVHPNDDYAKRHYNSLGKTECWYILDALDETKIIIGHKATKKDTIIQAIAQNKYDDILNKIPIKKADMFQIPAGTIHAICAGTVLLEVQQSSNLTFRFYDYNRLENGKPRELHQTEALDVLKIPDNKLIRNGNTKYFNFMIIDNLEQTTCQADQYGDYYFVIDGIGKMGESQVKKGDFIFVSSKDKYEIIGKLKLAKINLKN